jgi:hypothetical protein
MFLDKTFESEDADANVIRSYHIPRRGNLASLSTQTILFSLYREPEPTLQYD